MRPVERNPYILTPPPEGGPALTREPDGGIHALDLDKVITAEFDDAQWLIEPIIPAHRAVALYAAGKTGKSLLILDLVAAAASGRNILGGAPLEAPIRILYVDQEMTQPDLARTSPQSRLRATRLRPSTKHLHYYQLSPWPPLDTPAGGQCLLSRSTQSQSTTRRHRHSHPHRRQAKRTPPTPSRTSSQHTADGAQSRRDSSATHRPRRQRPHPRTTRHLRQT